MPALAERYLSSWYKIAAKANWSNLASLKQTFGSADQVGHYVVFDIGNNHYRLIALVKYCQGTGYLVRQEGDGPRGIRQANVARRVRLPHSSPEEGIGSA